MTEFRSVHAAELWNDHSDDSEQREEEPGAAGDRDGCSARGGALARSASPAVLTAV
jgi:hypothetical protein